MRIAWSAGAAALLAFSTLAQSTAVAAVFPDVPDGYVYQEPIERLVGLKVINGNPDGTFKPERAVNRAEMLTMLYRALDRTPALAAGNCFRDVTPGSWYESVVCDAAAQRVVEGYSDGTFRPQKEVNRVEALKMIMNMFGLSVDELSQQMRNVVKFVDVSLSAWYTKYLYAAFTQGILPIAGQVGPRFYPDAPLLRGEAAAYIYNALQQKKPAEEPVPEEEASSSSVAEEVEMSASSSARPAPAGPLVKQVDFPFSDEGPFVGKQAIAYRFALKAPLLADVSIRLGAKSAKVTCRLFKLTEQGLSAEYYLGLQVHETCWIRAALGAGSYQLDVQPNAADANFVLATKVVTGDGNDGLRDAKTLTIGTPRAGTLEIDDFSDWYTFRLTKETTMTVRLSANPEVRVLIYPMEDVDLYGFSGPQANESYAYPPGTYNIAVLRGDPAFGRLSYTLTVK